MTSACGDEAGTLAYHMTALMTSQSPDACSIRPLTDDYTGDMSVRCLREQSVYITGDIQHDTDVSSNADGDVYVAVSDLIVAGFRYDDNCPVYFLDDLELCAVKYFYSQRSLLFRTDNDLVAMTTNPVSITDACR